jgi:UDP-glucose 4-epimerase
MPTCLVTGGAGFIGSHLARSVAEDGWQVRVLDDFSTGKRENLAEIAGRIEVIDGDVRDRACVARAVAGVEVVFHEAAMVSVPKSVAEPVACHEICATGTLNVLVAAREAGVRRVVYAASASAYGNTAECPVREDGALDPQSPYAAAKLAAEHYCSAFSATTDLETVRLRYFNVFGPQQDPSSPYSGVISIFATRMLAGTPPTVFGDGLQSRDFVDVVNVVRANRLAAEVSGINGRVFNVGAGGRISLLDLVAAMNRILGTNLAPQFAEPRVGDVRHSQADIAAARRFLGYESIVSFEAGLARCLDYYRQLSEQ